METGYLIVLLIAALACPISMWLMMRGHGRQERRQQGPNDRQRPAIDRTVQS